MSRSVSPRTYSLLTALLCSLVLASPSCGAEIRALKAYFDTLRPIAAKLAARENVKLEESEYRQEELKSSFRMTLKGNDEIVGKAVIANAVFYGSDSKSIGTQASLAVIFFDDAAVAARCPAWFSDSFKARIGIIETVGIKLTDVNSKHVQISEGVDGILSWAKGTERASGNAFEVRQLHVAKDKCLLEIAARSIGLSDDEILTIAKDSLETIARLKPLERRDLVVNPVLELIRPSLVELTEINQDDWECNRADKANLASPLEFFPNDLDGTRLTRSILSRDYFSHRNGNSDDIQIEVLTFSDRDVTSAYADWNERKQKSTAEFENASLQRKALTLSDGKMHGALLSVSGNNQGTQQLIAHRIFMFSQGARVLEVRCERADIPEPMILSLIEKALTNLAELDDD